MFDISALVDNYELMKVFRMLSLKTNLHRKFFLIKLPVGLLAVFVLASPLTSLATYGGGEPTVFNPDVFTDQSSLLRVEGQTGALTQSIPIILPPGRNGVQPDLTLDYNSQVTEDSIVGYGWSLSIPYIQRLNKTGTQDLYTSSATFTSSLDGELVQVSPTGVTHRARVDTGAYNAYSFSGNTWTMYDKKGTRYLFGSTDEGRQFDTATSSTKTYKWMLQEIRDTNNNYVKFTYSKDSNALYPYKIIYTGSGALDGPFSVTFATSTRSDIRESYKLGFKVTTKFRISEISSDISGDILTKYILSYTTGSNGSRSLLSSVQRQGYAEDDTLTVLPATTFTYKNSPTMFYAPGNSGGMSLTSQAYIPADVNGNGINDVAYFYDNNNGTGSHALLYIDQTTEVSGYVPPDYWGYLSTAQERGVRFLDVNGDGKTDLLKGFQNDQAGTTTTNLYINTFSTSTGSYSWIASTTFSGVIPPFGYRTVNGNYTMTSGLFGEINGDGTPDYVMSLPSYTGSATYLGNGSSWTSTTTLFGAPYSMPTTQPTDIASQLVDVNGDGLDDWMSSDRYSTFVRLNTGTTWESTASSQWTIATSTLYYALAGGQGGTEVYYDRGIRFFDINGDALVDFVRSYSASPHNACAGAANTEVGNIQVVLLNTGNGWATSTAYTLPQHITVAQVNGAPNPCNFSGVFNHQEYANWIGNGQMNQDVITQIGYSTGGKKNVIYTPSTQLSTNPELPVSLLVVTETAEDDGFGTVASTTYSYAGGKIYLDDGIKDKKFSGFAISTTTAPDSITATYFSQADGLQSSLGEQNDSFAHINKPFRKDIFDLTLNPIQRTYYRWDTSDASGSIFTGLGSEMSFNFGSGGTHKDKATTYAYSSGTRDVTQMIEYGEVTGSVAGTFTDIGSDKRTTIFSYVASTTVNMSLPKGKTLLDNFSATTTDERYYYDSLALGSVTKGNQTKIEKLKTGSTYVSEQKAYNTYGLIASSTDPRGKTTAYTYDSLSLYVASSTNPLSHQTQFYYDYSVGKPKQTTDPNGHVFETAYDGIDRPLAEKQPDLLTPSTSVTKKTYVYTDTIGARRIIETNHLDSSTESTLYKYFDGLDRVIQTRKEAEETDQFSVKDFGYDKVGLLKRESLPYFSNGTSRTTASPNEQLFTRYTYDALKRVGTMANAVGTTTNTYDQWKTTTTDPLGNSKDFSYDAYGRLAEVVEYNDGTPYTTSYTYDPLGNLTKITDADSNIRNFTYDGLSRRLSAEDLHDVADGTFGTWSYVYDASSNLASSTDPLGSVVDYTYDDLNRVTIENHTGVAGNEVEYAYDSCTNGIGKLCVATSTGAVSSSTYNALGLTASEKKTIANTPYITSFTYDRQGNTTGIVYPDNAEVSYTYNTAGLLESIAHKESGGSFLNLVSDLDYAPTEQVAFKSFANGVQSTYTYNPNELYRLTNIYTTAPEGGGGGFALLQNNFWGTLAKAVEELPFALKLALETFGDTEETIDEQPLEETPSEPASEPVNTAISAEIVTEGTVAEDSTSTPLESEEVVVTAEVEIVTAEEEPQKLLVEETQKPLPEETPTEALTISVPTPSIRSLLEEKTPEERASIKGEEIAKRASLGRVSRDGYDIEVVSIEAIEGGVQAFVRAWRKDGSQIGFGTDGTVDMERFRIFNPPILVPDEKGDIVQTWEEHDVVTDTFVTRTRTLREDPHEAMLQVLEHNLSVMKNIHGPENIVSEKRGNTTSTYFPASGYLNSPVDGTIQNAGGSGVSWSTVRSASTGNYSSPDSSAGSVVQIAANQTDNTYVIIRSFFLFDTVSLPDTDVISNASISLYMTARSTSQPLATTSDHSIVLLQSSPAATNTLVDGDYDQVGLLNSPTEGSNRYHINNDFTMNQRNDVVLNSNGLSWINKTGITKFGFRHTADVDNVQPTQQNGAWSGINIYFAEQSGTSQDPKLVIEHTFPNDAPTEPTSLLAEGQTNPVNVTDSTPEFSAIFNDTNSADVAQYYQIQVATSSTFSTTHWDSTKTLLASSTPPGMRIADVPYTGATLASSTTYYWRIKFWDSVDASSPWSTATSTFSLEAGYSPPPAGVGGIQNISFVYDAVGNITEISDSATSTTLTRTVLYAYDDLYRLTSASTTIASSTPYSHTYTYNKLGNLLSMTGNGTYTYAETGYANPHAPTSINGVTHSYDRNGNLTNFASTTNTWDYRNRLSAVYASSSPSTFVTYDHSVQRVSKGTGTATTTYPNKYYTVSASGTKTKHVFAGNDLIATVETTSSGGAGDSGAKTAGATPSTTGWSNFTTTRLGTSDNSDASCNSTCDNTDNGHLGTFTFNIPAGATINGIEVKAEMAEGSSSGNIGTLFSLSWNNGTNFTSTKSITVDGTTDSVYTAGNSTDTWGRTWSDTELSNANFRLKLDKSDSSDTLYVDHVTVKVFYTTSGTSSTTIQYIHPDHLGSTNVVTDTTGAITQTLDYYPYGAERISTGTNTTERHFIGERFDAETNLNYLNARYYKGTKGQFLSQDPVFLTVSDSKNLREKTKLTQEQFLADPQLANSYSYARNNPIRLKDPEGNLPFLPAIMLLYGFAQTGVNFYDFKTTFIDYPQQFSRQEKIFTAGTLGVGLLIGGAGAVGERTSRTAISTFSTSLDILDHLFAPGVYDRTRFNRNNSSQKTNTQLNFSPNQTVRSSQSSALSGIQKSFVPTNTAQSSALQGVINAFSKKQ